jgi:predicted ArsR family transcriptional regulator
MADLGSSVTGVAALAEPVRRDLYLYVVAQAEPVSRQQAADGVGVATHIAKFHLDKLALEGLLDVEFRRRSGRAGPGAGRPTKLYRKSQREVSISLPQRQYALAAELMARAIDAAAQDGRPVVETLHREADALGRSIAARAGPPPDVCSVLAEQGFEPHEERGTIRLGNCPFAALAHEHTELVCAMNLALVAAIASASGEPGLSPRLDPTLGRCCVVLSPPPPGRHGTADEGSPAGH